MRLLTQRIQAWITRLYPDRMVKGGRCGCCGQWVEDCLVSVYWRWTLCDDCAGNEIETEIWNLIRDIEAGKRWLYKQPPQGTEPSYLSWHYGNVEFISNDGWRVVVFFDCGEFDYFDSFTSPTGKVLGYDKFSDSLKAYRPPDDVCKVMYGEPGYLGCWLGGNDE